MTGGREREKTLRRIDEVGDGGGGEEEWKCGEYEGMNYGIRVK